MPPFGGRASALSRFGDGARRDVAWRARRRARAPERGARAARGARGTRGRGARVRRARGTSLGARARAPSRAMTRAASADALSWMGGGAMQSSMLGAALVDFGIQLVGWAAAATLRTEKFYDILGSAAFATTAALTLGTSAMMPRQKLASALAMAWTARLGIFLGARAHRDGGGLAIRRREGQARGVRGVLVPPRRVGVGDVVTGVSVERGLRVNWWI